MAPLFLCFHSSLVFPPPWGAHTNLNLPSMLFYARLLGLGRGFSQERRQDLAQNGGAAFEWKAGACPLLHRKLLQPCSYLNTNAWAVRPRAD